MVKLMEGIRPLLLVMAAMTLTLATPGVKMRVTDKGIQYANKVAETELHRILGTVTIPNLSGGGRFSWEIKNIQPKGIIGPNTQIHLSPSTNGLTLRVFNFAVNLHADWKIKYRIIFQYTSSGTVDASFSGASLSLTAKLGEKNGHPSIEVSSCNLEAGSVNVHFHGGLVAWILNMFKGTVQNKIKDILKNKACDLVTKLIQNTGNEKLAKLKVLVNLGPRFLLDYSLVGKPLVTSSYLESNHKGVIYWREAIQESPVPAPVFPPLNDVSKMFYLVLTDFIFNTFAYQAHKNTFLTYTIGLNELPADLRHLLDTTAQIGAWYPNSKLEFRISSAQPPTLTTRNGQLTFWALGNLDVLVTAVGKPADDVLTLAVNASLTARPVLVNNRLTATLNSQSYININVKRSTFGPVTDMGELNTRISELSQQFIIPGLNELCRQGIDLPVTGYFRLKTPQLDVKQGAVVVATDVELI